MRYDRVDLAVGFCLMVIFLDEENQSYPESDKQCNDLEKSQPVSHLTPRMINSTMVHCPFQTDPPLISLEKPLEAYIMETLLSRKVSRDY
jgi:hypothetical protein